MYQAFHRDNPDLLWVYADAPDVGCTGAYESPFSTPEIALSRVKPGQTIVLMAGEYVGDCSFQVSGAIRSPIRICAEPDATVIVKSACWFFYDTSDLIVSGLTFVDAPAGAISLVGSCSRNRFENLRFINCSTRGDTACTLYMGGAGGGCNIVEDCDFEGTVRQKDAYGQSATVSVGILLAQGDTDSGNPIVNNVIRRNRFSGYEYGIIIGSDGEKAVRCGHIIEYNTVKGCSREGILVKCGDTTVRGNIVSTCSGTAISIRSALDCSAYDNRIVDSHTGMQLHGRGHSVTNNCFVNCTDGAVRVRSEEASPIGPAANCFIEHNSFINCTSPAVDDGTPVCGIMIDPGTTGIVQQNLIFGSGKPYAVILPPNEAGTLPETRFIIKDNRASGGCTAIEGAGHGTVMFTDAPNGDYRNDSGYGASGWVATPAGFDPSIDDNEGEIDYREACLLEDDQGDLAIPGEDDDRENLFGDFFSGRSSRQSGRSEGDEPPWWYPGDD